MTRRVLALFGVATGCIIEANPRFDGLGDTTSTHSSSSTSAGDESDSSSASSNPSGGTSGAGSSDESSGGEEPRPAASICAGWDHTCVLVDDGRVFCWGSNRNGQLGDGTFATRSTPVQADLPPAQALWCGDDWTCAATAGGVPACWGWSPVEARSIATPVALEDLSDVEELDFGWSHGCARLGTGQVTCWGNNHEQQIGADTNGPVEIPGIENAIDLTVHSDHNCVLSESGRVHCWGDSDAGQAGELSDTVWPPAEIAIDEVVALSSAPTLACALRADGSAWCWGANWWQRFGNDAPEFNPVPVRLGELERASELRVLESMERRNCAATIDAVYCWGGQEWGEGETRVLDGVVDLALGWAHSCGLQGDGRIWCWGTNSVGQLGIGSPEHSTSFAQVDLTGATWVDVGRHSACAVTSDASAVCWGANGSGQLGTGDASNVVGPVAAVQELDGTVARVVVGERTACAIRTDESLWCWGNNEAGMLGDGSDVWDSFSPVAVMDGVSEVEMTSRLACARTTTGAVHCWGDNDHGQLGIGFESDDSNVPLDTGLTGVIDIAVGQHFACAVGAAGEVWCWGSNDWSKLGDGSWADTSSPVSIQIDEPIIALATGRHHACALESSGARWCWGTDFERELGAATRLGYFATPTRFECPCGAFSAIDANGSRTCGIVDDALWCTGRNDHGQAGTGEAARLDAFEPAVIGDSPVVQVSIDEDFGCVRLADGSIWCAGKYASGQLGDTRVGTEHGPTEVVIP